MTVKEFDAAHKAEIIAQVRAKAGERVVCTRCGSWIGFEKGGVDSCSYCGKHPTKEQMQLNAQNPRPVGTIGK